MTDQFDRLAKEARSLSADERAKLMDLLWETFEPDSPDLPVPEWQNAELDHRLAEHEADPKSAVSWEEAYARLAARCKP